MGGDEEVKSEGEVEGLALKCTFWPGRQDFLGHFGLAKFSSAWKCYLDFFL